MQSVAITEPHLDANEVRFVVQPDRNVAAIFAVCVLGAIPVALLPGFFYPTNLRQALAFSVIPLGTWLMLRAAFRGDSAARLGAVFIAVALVSAVMSDHVLLSTFGTVNLEMSVAALTAAFGWWAVGRQLSRSTSHTLLMVLTVGAGVNILVGVLQVVLDPRVGMYATFGGRLSGLMSNPVYFASTFVGVWAYWFVRMRRDLDVYRSVLAPGLALCLGLSGSRVSLIIVALVVLVTVVRDRGNRVTLLNGAASILAVGIGTVVLNAASEEQALRYSSGDSGLALRLAVWRNALSAWADKPLQGTGLDPYLREANQRFGRAQVSEFGSMQWPDPHNVVLLVLLSLGAIGLAVLVAFILIACRGNVHAPLLAAAGAMAMSWLMQPVVVTTWPIAFALFGAAVLPREPAEPPAARVEHVLVAAGVVIATSLIAWNLRFTEALSNHDDGSVADSRASVMIHDPSIAARVADKYLTEARDGTATADDLERAERLASTAVARSSAAAHWALLAEIQLARSDPAGALDTSRRWVADWPNDPRGYRYLGATADMTGQTADRDRAADALCEIRNECERSDRTTESDE